MNTRRKPQAQTGLEMLKEATLEVLLHNVGMQRQEVTDALGLCLDSEPGKSGEIISGVLCLLREEDHVKNEGQKWYRCG